MHLGRHFSQLITKCKFALLPHHEGLWGKVVTASRILSFWIWCDQYS